MPVVDASVWVAISYARDPAHERCFSWFDSVLESGEGLIAPTLLAVEVAGALRRLTGQQAMADDVLEELYTLRHLHLVALERDRARLAAQLAAATGLRGADAVYLALAEERQQTLFTLDNQQAERAQGLVEVRIL